MQGFTSIPTSAAESVVATFTGLLSDHHLMSGTDPRTVLWWSRSGHDYSRNRVILAAMKQLGWTVRDFRPWFSRWGHVEAMLRRIERPSLVWVPCFRQRDAEAAVKWARRTGVPAIFDPLISAYDKQVFEHQKFAPESAQGRALRDWEARLMQQFDLVIADTECHAEFFRDCFGLSKNRVAVIPVGAEEAVFTPRPMQEISGRVRVMFYGSFIGLQGPEVIADACAQVPEVQWTFVGSGPLLESCQQRTAGLSNVSWIPWIPYEQLPDRIADAHILLGVFGSSQKAGRVIPNKVYQAMACGRPVVTQHSPAYPQQLLEASPETTGVQFVPPGDSGALAAAVRSLAASPEQLARLGGLARTSYERWFSAGAVQLALQESLQRVVK